MSYYNSDYALEFTMEETKKELDRIRILFEKYKSDGDIDSIRALLDEIYDITPSNIDSNVPIMRDLQSLSYEIDEYVRDMSDSFDFEI